MTVTQDPQGSVTSSLRRAGKSATAFRTISEAAGELDLPQHVLRFWESKFPQIRPMKRGGGRRYYRPEDMDLLRRIRSLLYEDGYTIKGVQKILKDPHARAGVLAEVPDDMPADDDEGPEQMAEEALVSEVRAAPVAMAAPTPRQGVDRAALLDILAELEAIRRML